MSSTSSNANSLAHSAYHGSRQLHVSPENVT